MGVLSLGEDAIKVINEEGHLREEEVGDDLRSGSLSGHAASGPPVVN